jgi:hypothetical protein
MTSARAGRVSLLDTGQQPSNNDRSDHPRPPGFGRLTRSHGRYMRARDAAVTAAARLLDRLRDARIALRRLGRGRPR